jgi:hypothetical protein
MTKVLVLYYSSFGHIEQMAYAEAEGARSAGATVDVKRVPRLCGERLLDNFYGINRRPKFGPKLLDCFFHGGRQVSPPVKNATHRFFDS